MASNMSDDPVSTQGSDRVETPTNSSGKGLAETTRRRTKHITRACNPCRQKKTKCSGERPKCTSCIVYNIDCIYDATQDRRRPIYKAYVAALEDRIAWLEKSLGESEKGAAESPRVATGTDEQGEGKDASDWPDDTECREPAERLQIDDVTGEVQDYGPTSMFKHVPPTADSSTSVDHESLTPLDTPLSSGESPAVALDDFMHGDCLRLFFSFFNPWCMWVDEAQFRLHMDTNRDPSGSVINRNVRTAFYSPLLHLSILAIGVMYMQSRTYPEKRALADALGREAARFFEEEIEGSKQSAVSGLMLLGSHHAAHARPSLGYIYSGTGLRLSRILGLGIDASCWVERGLITTEVKRARDRVWHCAYIQDKLWSTYVGRSPSPSLSRYRMPSFEVNDDEDATNWCSFSNTGQDMPRKSWLSSAMAWTSKLAIILDIILENVNPSRRPALSGKTKKAKHEICVWLEKWYAELPDPLRIKSAVLCGQANGTALLPHILTMNMMYHFTVIMLNQADNRWGSRDEQGLAGDRCRQAAGKVLQIAELFDQTFGLCFAPVSMTQFVFTAGTTHLLGAAHGEHAANKVAPTTACVKALHSMGQTWKSASLSGDILQKLLQDVTRKDAGLPAGTPRPTGDASTSHAVNVSDLLRHDPDIANQLRKLGWVPPDAAHAPTPHSEALQEPEFNAAMGYETAESQASHAPAVQEMPMVDAWAQDMSWAGPTPAWNDYSWPPALFDMVMASDRAAPQAWGTPFGLDLSDSWDQPG